MVRGLLPVGYYCMRIKQIYANRSTSMQNCIKIKIKKKSSVNDPRPDDLNKLYTFFLTAAVLAKHNKHENPINLNILNKLYIIIIYVFSSNAYRQTSSITMYNRRDFVFFIAGYT